MPFLEPVPITLTLPNGVQHECEGILSPDATSSVGTPEVVGLNIPLTLHQQREVIVNDEPISLEEIKEEILYLLNEGIEVSETGAGIKFEADRADLQQTPVNQYFCLATYNGLLAFHNEMKEVQARSGGGINNAIISDTPFAHKAMLGLLEKVEVIPFMLSSKDVSPEFEEILKNNINYNVVHGVVKAAVNEIIEKSDSKHLLASSMLGELSEKVGLLPGIEEAVLANPSMKAHELIALSQRLTENDPAANQALVTSVCLQAALLGAVEIRAEQINHAMPLVEVSSEIISKQIDSHVNAHHLSGTVFFEKLPLDLQSGESITKPIALLEPIEGGQYRLSKGANLEQLADVLKEKCDSPVQSVSVNHDHAYEIERPSLQ